MRSALETTYEVTKLIKLSLRCDALFQELQAESDLSSESCSVSIKLLCPTRWTVRAESPFSILNNYLVLLSTWEQARDTEIKAQIQGVSSQMSTFKFLFGTFLGELSLRHTDNLSKSLQDKTRSAAEGQQIADMVVRTLSTLRCDDSFDLFWLKVLKKAELLDLEPQLPRHCKRPRRFDDGLAESEFHDDPKAYFRQLYYEAVDLVSKTDLINRATKCKATWSSCF